MVLRHVAPRILVSALVCLLFSAITALALQPPTTDPLRPGPYAGEVQKGRFELEPIANGSFNTLTGATACLTNLEAGPFAGGPEMAARSYLQQEAARFALKATSDDLSLVRLAVAPGGLHARFAQTVGGVPIYGAGMVVSLDETGTIVRSVTSEYDPLLAGQSIATIPVWDAAQAERAAREAVGIDEHTPLAGEPPVPSLWILRENDDYGAPATLAWRVCVPITVEPRGDWEVFVDARDGSILRITDQTWFVDGSGYGFDPDPLTTARVAYGATGYVDGNDADTPQLTAQRVPCVLREITYSGGLYRLQGPWVYIDEFDAPVSTPVTSTTPDGFAYTRNAQGFEDVNGYNQIDSSQRYMQSLGFFDIQHAPIHVDVHGWSGQDQSSYTPSTNRLSFGEGGVDDAEDADVLHHEYGHAIQNSIISGYGTTVQARSMGEGFGDYWAGSYSAGISDYRDVWVFNWDGHNPYWSGRVLNSSLGYSNLNGDIYHDGTIWASCWWLIHNEVGQKVCDRDMLKLHYYGMPGTGMIVAAQNAMQADRDLYGGLHAGSLDYFFTLRGFFTASQFDVPAVAHTSLPDQYNIGPFPITAVFTSTSAMVNSTVKVKFGTGAIFDQEALLTPTGNPNEYSGFIPSQPAGSTIRYYIVGSNTANWPGTAPRGAEYQYYSFQVLVDPADVADRDGASRLVLEPVHPNPSPGATAVRFQMPSSGNVRLQVNDICGRGVRTLCDETMSAGEHTLVWDGRDDAGRELPTGLYFIRVSAVDQSQTRKLLLTR